ncbi:hypothetical protein [Tenacibaculum sp. M341]|uniref:hypothetical protein n=1 Tax=Tenacibaculum sp. M341 TaxID=2530339 RepID=UPI00104C64A2|nr:hypothetical protein [Tenacibaculum sp. M341]TCI85323.1 hypothetical protein EYW44_17265 [Tenacibaculum sp. M341]
MNLERINTKKVNILQSIIDEVASIGTQSECYEKLETSKVVYSLLRDYPHNRSLEPESIDSVHICLAKSYLEIGILASNQLTNSLDLAITCIECALSELVDSFKKNETKYN